ncbi:MAG: hypothetical protein V1875_00115 [Candidatus Altiarchaeota archaeon]
MSDDLCPECVEELKQMALAKAAAAGGDKNAQKEVEALSSAGVPEDVDDEVRSMLNSLISKRNDIAATGRYRDLSYIDSIIGTARSHYLGKEYDLALDNISSGVPEVNHAYNVAIYQVQAESKLKEVEDLAQTMRAQPAAKTGMGEGAEVKNVESLVEDAKKLISDGKFKEASEKLSSADTQKTEKKK